MKPFWGIEKTIGYQTVDALSEHNGLEMSGHIAFTALLSLFPFLIFFAAVGGFVGRGLIRLNFTETDLVGTFLTQSLQFLPANVTATLVPVLQEVLTIRSISLVSISAILALWGASACVQAIRTSLNKAYHARKRRRLFLIRRIQDMGLVFLGTMLLFTMTVCIILYPLFLHHLQRWVPLPETIFQDWKLWRYGFAALILISGNAAFQKWLPNTRLKWRQVLPGAILSSCAWLGMSSLFTLYFIYVPRQALIYGSLAGVVITLLFFYVSALIFIFGAELNATLIQRRTGKKLRDALQMNNQN